MAQFSSSAYNVNQNQRLSVKPADLQLLTKTHSACNVFERHTNSHARNSLNAVDSGPYSLQYDNSYRKEQHCGVSDRLENNNNGSANNRGYSEKRVVRVNVRRGNSAENVNGSGMDKSSANMKKVKFENEVSFICLFYLVLSSTSLGISNMLCICSLRILVFC